jgi:hypothetical protein
LIFVFAYLKRMVTDEASVTNKELMGTCRFLFMTVCVPYVLYN